LLLEIKSVHVELVHCLFLTEIFSVTSSLTSSDHYFSHPTCKIVYRVYLKAVFFLVV